ncbi:HAD family hydrolase [Microbulbifer taiwanensis]|uniref:HAD family hydrolase n=1 Tax=Microbulbifer taiwanensis TaxID=986746 RepID=A0ABW1YJP7_9GAMM|nr:HAD family phosphatase [Microbulbifer taiwanensis]
MSIDIEVVLFDLGGVLIELRSSPLPPEWLSSGQTFDSIGWFQSETALRFECGELSPDEFARRLQRDLGLEVDNAEIIDQFTRWPIGLFAGARDLLLQLRKSHHLAALTNTNELHWPRLVNEFRLPQYFSQIFASHRMALAKPDLRAFRHVMDALNVAPERVLFFDDNPTNVIAARRLGIRARQACSVEQVKVHLQESGLLAD